MEQIEVIEGNRLIAFFMGAKEDNEFPGHPLLDFGEFIKTTPFQEPGVWILGDGQVKYHSSWDWIMLVLKKIAIIVSDKLADNYIQAKSRWAPIANELQNCKLENVWYCVVQFIRWYNQSTKQQEDNS